MKNSILLLGLYFLLTSCLSVKGLEKKINKVDDVELGFLNTSKKVEKLDKHVKLFFEDSTLDTISNVKKNKKSFMTLIFFYTYKNDYQVHFGKNNLNRTYENFFVDELYQESLRSAVFDFNLNPMDQDHKLYLELTDFDFQYNYYDSYFALILPFVSLSTQEKRLSNDVSKLKIKAVLKDKYDNVVLEKDYESSILNETPAESVDLYSNKSTPSSIMYNFEDTINENSKEIIYHIINDVNNYFTKGTK